MPMIKCILIISLLCRWQGFQILLQLSSDAPIKVMPVFILILTANLMEEQILYQHGK